MIVQTNNLSRVFRTEEVETTALKNINITINKGEFVSIMGPSGCGKSTLLNIIGLLDKGSSGEYLLLNENTSKMGEKERSEFRKKNIGFVFQSFNLIDELSVFENVELPLVYQKVEKKEREEKVQYMLEKFSIAHRRNHFPQQLSGGQQQRVAIARALVSSPSLILADEPTGNLDSQHGSEVMEILSNLNANGTTIVMVTHSEHDAAYSHRTIRLLDGSVIAEVMNQVKVNVI